ncbi:MAG: hypothetical protein AVDCRST_MAG19-4313, partial [uncultured Thermomicrobiales bacterium]
WSVPGARSVPVSRQRRGRDGFARRSLPATGLPARRRSR